MVVLARRRGAVHTRMQEAQLVCCWSAAGRRSLTGAVWETCAFANLFYQGLPSSLQRGDISCYAHVRCFTARTLHLAMPTGCMGSCARRLAAAPTVLLNSYREVGGGRLTLNTNKCHLLCCVSVAAALQSPVVLLVTSNACRT